ncbi:MAG: beta-ketoacyl synthase N-terminal-like domain-containing protein [Polyangiaceae bacterium]
MNERRARAAVIAVGAVSPLGIGRGAFPLTTIGEPAPVAIERDRELVELGFLRPFAARAPSQAFEGAPVGEDRATTLLHLALDQALASVAPSDARVALVLGTSSGGMCSAEQLFRERLAGRSPEAALARRSTYFAPFEDARERLASRGHRVVRSMQIATACAASTWSLGVALRWLERGVCDLVFAGGYDAVGPFVAAGFESLRATSASRPAPFRIGRDGMALGEGAGIAVLTREGDERGARPLFFVSGFGASTDAVHVTAPDRTGGGLARAARAALADAAVEASVCPLVSAHATATPYNDAMESRAIDALFGESRPIVHPFKAQIGHTLGAAGILESLALARTIEDGVAPAAAGTGELDPDAPARLLARAEALEIPVGLKLSAAFGGANASLVLERADRPARSGPRVRRPVYLHAVGRATKADAARVATVSGYDADKVSRADAISLTLATAIAEVAAVSPASRSMLAGAGIIVGHALATIDINERFYARILSKGPTAAEPRLFPPTSPNLMPGQVAIYFGLTGPSAALASGVGHAIDPLALAVDMVAFGDAEAMIAAAVDVLGPASKFVLESAFADADGVAEGAVAALLSTHAEGAIATLDADSVEALRTPRGFGQRSLSDALDTLR